MRRRSPRERAQARMMRFWAFLVATMTRTGEGPAIATVLLALEQGRRHVPCTGAAEAIIAAWPKVSRRAELVDPAAALRRAELVGRITARLASLTIRPRQAWRRVLRRAILDELGCARRRPVGGPR